MVTARPLRDEVWFIDFDPVRGHEQAGRRPGILLSTDLFNSGPAGLHVVLPITRSDRRVRWQVPVQPPEGGLRELRFVKCENVRSISIDRFAARWGVVSPGTMAAIEGRLRMLLEL